MKIRISHTFDVTDVIEPADVQRATEALASIMLVQAEDGLYTLGSPDAEFEGESSEPVAALRCIEFEAVVEPVTESTMTIKDPVSDVRFLARVLRKGTPYGLNNALVWDDDRAGVEFYDTRYAHTRFGQFTGGRYFVETILGDDRYGSGVGGINLDAGVADWSLSADATDLVRDWLRWEV